MREAYGEYECLIKQLSSNGAWVITSVHISIYNTAVVLKLGLRYTPILFPLTNLDTRQPF